MPQTEAQRKAKNKYNDKTYDQINCRLRREDRYLDRLALACEKTKKSQAEYIKDALDAQFVRDGVTVDMLDGEEAAARSADEG